MGMGQKRSTREATIILLLPLNVKEVHPINRHRENKRFELLQDCCGGFFSGFASKYLQ